MYVLTFTAPNVTADAPNTYTLDPDRPRFRELIEDMPPMHRRVLRALVTELSAAITSVDTADRLRTRDLAAEMTSERT